MSEDRATLRALTHLAGHASIDQASREALPCLVRNLSPIGACLLFCTEVTAPERFDLFLDPEAPAYRVRRVWQHENEVGVSFLEARENAPEVIPDADPAAP